MKKEFMEACKKVRLTIINGHIGVNGSDAFDQVVDALIQNAPHLIWLLNYTKYVYDDSNKPVAAYWEEL